MTVNSTHYIEIEALKKLRVIIRAAQRHSSWIEKQCGITGAQLWVMQELYETPGQRVGEIAKKLVIHATTASNLIDALVKNGHIRKTRSETDQRVVTLELSESGLDLMKKAPTPARGLIPEALSRMEEGSLRQLNDGLQAVIDAIDAADDAFGLQPLPFTM
jgi:DNA-binding MarR family transcriptional regulator